MLMPPVDRYMTRQPFTIRKATKVAAAQKFMKEQRVRHLPILEDGKLVGIISERDLKLIGRLLGDDPSEINVEEIMQTDVYGTTTDTSLDQVLDYMAEHKIGSCVVMDQRGRVQGIFTTVDALQCFAELLRRETA